MYCCLEKLRSSLLDPGKALSLTDKAFDLAKGMTMKVNNALIANKRPIKTEYDEINIKRKKEDDLPIIKEEALSMGQVFSFLVSEILLSYMLISEIVFNCVRLKT